MLHRLVEGGGGLLKGGRGLPHRSAQTGQGCHRLLKVCIVGLEGGKGAGQRRFSRICVGQSAHHTLQIGCQALALLQGPLRLGKGGIGAPLGSGYVGSQSSHCRVRPGRSCAHLG